MINQTLAKVIIITLFMSSKKYTFYAQITSFTCLNDILKTLVCIFLNIFK